MWFVKKEHYEYPIEKIGVFVEQTTSSLLIAELLVKIGIMATVLIAGYKFFV